jgi:hypothetical protein
MPAFFDALKLALPNTRIYFNPIGETLVFPYKKDVNPNPPPSTNDNSTPAPTSTSTPVPTPQTSSSTSTSTSTSNTTPKPNTRFVDPPEYETNPSEYTILYIGGESLALNNILLTHSQSPVSRPNHLDYPIRNPQPPSKRT